MSKRIDHRTASKAKCGIADRIPQWAVQVEIEGRSKPYNRILAMAKQWAATEALALRACGIDSVIAQADELLALEGSK